MMVRWNVRLAMVGSLALVVGLAMVDRHHVGVFHDDAMYLVLAKSLATGQGYRYINLPDAPIASHFPPIYPLILSLIWRVFPGFPTNVLVFKALNGVLFATSAVLVMQLARERLGSARAATAIGIASAVSVPLLVLVSMVLSEPLFLASCLGVLLFGERIVSRSAGLHEPGPQRENEPQREYASPEENQSPEGNEPERNTEVHGGRRSRSPLWSSVSSVVKSSLSEREKTNTSAHFHVLLLGVAIGVATLVRTHGIVLVAAMMLPLLLRKRWLDAALVLVGTAAVLIPWQAWAATNHSPLAAPLAGNYGSYTSWWLRGFSEMGFSMIPATIERTSAEAGAMFTALFSPVRTFLVHILTKIALVIVALAGVLVAARRAPVTLGFLVLYGAIVATWPFPPSRFVWGVWPLVLFLLAAGAHAVFIPEWRARTIARLVVGTAALWLIVGHAAYELRALRGGWWASIPRSADARIAAAVGWVQRNTRPSDVVASDDEGSVYLYTGRRAVPVASFTTAHYLGERTAAVEADEGLVPLLDAYQIRYVLVGSQRTFAAAQHIASRPAPQLVLREQFPEGAAFTVLPR